MECHSDDNSVKYQYQGWSNSLFWKRSFRSTLHIGKICHTPDYAFQLMNPMIISWITHRIASLCCVEDKVQLSIDVSSCETSDIYTMQCNYSHIQLQELGNQSTIYLALIEPLYCGCRLHMFWPLKALKNVFSDSIVSWDSRCNSPWTPIIPKMDMVSEKCNRLEQGLDWHIKTNAMPR